MADQTSSGRGATPVPAASFSAPAGGYLAHLVALCSLLIAAGAGMVAIYSLNEAREAKSQAAIAAAGRAQTTPRTAPPASPSPTKATPVPSTSVSGGHGFIPDRVQAQLQLPAATGCASVYVDVDAMKVGVADGHEFYLSGCFGQPALRVDRTDAAAPTATVSTPETCAALLSGIQDPQELVLTVRAGLSFCLITHGGDALRLGQPQRLAVVEVRSVAADNTITLVISTYLMPAKP